MRRMFQVQHFWHRATLAESSNHASAEFPRTLLAAPSAQEEYGLG